MTLRVAVDFGTSSTCVAVSVDGREPQLVVVDGGAPVMPSAVFAAVDGTLFVGQEAERHAAVDPARYEPHPKRRIDEGELLLGSSVLRVLDVVRAVLTRAVGEARRVAGGAPVDLLVLTHPADWGAVRTGVLRQAGGGLSRELALVPEPVAAALFHSDALGNTIPDGTALAVLDLGGGTVDASVVRRSGGTFQVLATRGDPTFGGADVDQLLLEHVGGLVGREDQGAWQQLVEGREMSDRRRRRVLRQDVRGAKETLSRHTYTDVPMPPPFPDAHVTRADLERIVAGPLDRAAALVAATVAEAGLDPQRLAGVFLVGGSSRIPLVARLVHERTGIVPTSIDQPETVVARGALRAVSVDPQHTGSTPMQQYPGQSGPHAVPGTPPGGFGGQFPQPAPVGTSFPTSSFPSSVPSNAPSSAQTLAKPPRKPVNPWLVVGAVVAVVAVVGAVIVFLSRSNGDQPQGKQYAQYEYSFTAPADWTQSGGDPASRKVQLKPQAGGSDSNLIAVQETKLNYDATQERTRAVSYLKSLYDKGTNLSDYNDKASYGGKDVVYYREQSSGGTVDWYVLFQAKTQVLVGCQYADAGRDQVRSACEQVVRTMKITG
ncbi:type VII secretion-associated protein [Solihabitans fulvus]|uniref:Type VII secretion-associated protein n=1 Tax=Solihabitans fulvus TaxID=1892852 RepID=A0A5B2XMU0_9PSEU|nr:type VII secretion-associated protein [Solihabitans fulvus]KAA2264696.1 type VII secretion-associated protein [Solihabitans fulvus]